jgi:hypothetical protein
MSSIAEALDALDRAVDVLGTADWTQLADGERVGLLDRLETCARRQRAVSHAVIHGLDQAELGAPVAVVVADVLRISRTEARRRVRDAEQLAPRTSLIGQPLPPVLPATAAAWAAGVLDPEHLRTIQKFMRELPDHIGPGVAEDSEAVLAEKAALLRPDQLEMVADRLAITVNPDGVFSDDDRARKRGFLWCGRQRPDGMSVGYMVGDAYTAAINIASDADWDGDWYTTMGDQETTNEILRDAIHPRVVTSWTRYGRT